MHVVGTSVPISASSYLEPGAVDGAQLTRKNDLKKCVNSFHFVCSSVCFVCIWMAVNCFHVSRSLAFLGISDVLWLISTFFVAVAVFRFFRPCFVSYR